VEVTTRLQKSVKDVSFETVAAAVKYTCNIGGYIRPEVDRFLQDNKLVGVPHLFMATHSWGGRNWEFEEGRNPLFFQEEKDGGGWYILRAEDVKYVFYESMTSGSSLEAEKQGDGTWRLKLEVPVTEEDAPYTGLYWRSFHEALGIVAQKSAAA